MFLSLKKRKIIDAYIAINKHRIGVVFFFGKNQIKALFLADIVLMNGRIYWELYNNNKILFIHSKHNCLYKASPCVFLIYNEPVYNLIFFHIKGKTNYL